MRTLDNYNPNTSFSFLFAFTSSPITADTNPALKPLVNLVPNPLAASRAPSMESMGCDFPGSDNFSRFGRSFFSLLISLVQSGYFFSTINSAFYGVSPNPCGSNFARAI